MIPGDTWPRVRVARKWLGVIGFYLIAHGHTGIGCKETLSGQLPTASAVGLSVDSRVSRSRTGKPPRHPLSNGRLSQVGSSRGVGATCSRSLTLGLADGQPVSPTTSGPVRCSHNHGLKSHKLSASSHPWTGELPPWSTVNPDLDRRNAAVCNCCGGVVFTATEAMRLSSLPTTNTTEPIATIFCCLATTATSLNRPVPTVY